jgi:para-aminobenzoate synthetase
MRTHRMTSAEVPGPGKTWDDNPARKLRDLSARYRRCFWLDGGGAREWSGRRSMVGWLADDAVSLTYNAATRLTTKHRGNTAETLQADIFEALEAEVVAGPADAHWVGYFGYAARPDLTARPDPHLPDAVWMCATGMEFVDHTVRPSQSLAEMTADMPPPTTEYSAAFDRGIPQAARPQPSAIRRFPPAQPARHLSLAAQFLA